MAVTVVSDSKTVIVGGTVQGIPGKNGDAVPNFNMSFGDVAQRLIGTYSGLVSTVTIVVLQAYNATGAMLSVGTLGNPNLLYPATGLDLKQVIEFQWNPGALFATPTDIYVFFTQGIGGTLGQSVLKLEIS